MRSGHRIGRPFAAATQKGTDWLLTDPLPPNRFENSGQEQSRHLKVGKEEKADGGVAFIARMDDLDNNTVWELEISFNAANEGVYEIYERTPLDELSIIVEISGDTTLEIYTLNGNRLAVSYTCEELERYLDLCDLRTRGLPLGNMTRDLLILEKFDDFGEFYVLENSLNGNFDGIVMMELLQNEEFRTLIPKRGLSVARKVDLDSDVEKLCKWAERGTLKCALGGFANPFCHVAVGVTAACWTAELIEDVSGV